MKSTFFNCIQKSFYKLNFSEDRDYTENSITIDVFQVIYVIHTSLFNTVDDHDQFHKRFNKTDKY